MSLVWKNAEIVVPWQVILYQKLGNETAALRILALYVLPISVNMIPFLLYCVHVIHEDAYSPLPF